MLIVEVAPDSPGAIAGLLPGDIIQAIAGVKVTTAEQVQTLVEQASAGDRLPLSLNRQGKQLNLQVEVGVLPQNNV